MRHVTCPQCGLPSAEGSHWDCIFDLLEEWVKHRTEDERKIEPAAGEDLSVHLSDGPVVGPEVGDGVAEKKDEVPSG